MSTPDIQIVEDPVAVCADALMEAAAGGGNVALTGGSTPKAAYELAAQTPEAFAGSRLWFGDERCVPPDDERSNYAMAKQALLDPLTAAGVDFSVWRMKGELGHEAGASDYERAMEAAGAPPFSLVLLGLGPDGHTLSLFPGQPSLFERSRLVVGVPEAGHEPYVPRISFTLPVLEHAERVLVMATGSSKADAVARAFGSGVKPTPDVPASFLAEHARSLTVLLDRDAAAQL